MTMASELRTLPKMMLGFVVRRCAAAVGHDPTPEEFVAWANNYANGEDSVRLFGRAITIAEARLILRHPGRSVTARGAAPHECVETLADAPASNVTSFVAAVARLKARKG